MAGFKERIFGEVSQLRAMRREQPEVPMLSMGVPKWMAVVVVFGAIALLMQAWTRHQGRGAGAVGGGVMSHAETTHAETPQTERGVGTTYRVYYAPGDDLAGLDARLLVGATKSLDVAAAGDLSDGVCRAIAGAARRGASVRVLRSAAGYAAEQERAGGSCSEALPSTGVLVRVAAEGLAWHSYAVDGRVLRSGTADFGMLDGKTGEELSVAQSEGAVGDFERSFLALWAVPENRVIRAGTQKAE